MSSWNLSGEIALVTGASRGIGASIAIELGRCGATVIGTATSESGAQHISDSLQSAGIKGGGRVLNVTDPASVEALMQTMEADPGAPSILVNNAGITRDNLLLRMKDEEWDTVIETNLKSVYRMSKACLRAMMKLRRGRIVNVASVVGVMGNPGQANYAAAKGGMIAMSKALAREVGSRGITVNCVAPGFIDTDMTRALPEEQRKGLLALVPLNRFGTPQEVAHAVAFLASPSAGYVTGTTLHVNGGMYML